MQDSVGLVLSLIVVFLMGAAVVWTWMKFGKDWGLVALGATLIALVATASVQDLGVSLQRVGIFVSYFAGMTVGYQVAVKLPSLRRT